MITNITELKNRFQEWTDNKILETDTTMIKTVRDELVGSEITIEELCEVLNTDFKGVFPVNVTPSFIDTLLENANTTRW